MDTTTTSTRKSKLDKFKLYYELDVTTNDVRKQIKSA